MHIVQLLVLLVSSIWYLVSAPQAHATGEFSTAFRSIYTIEPSGVADVEHHIDITNNLAHIYTTRYTLALGSDQISQLTATIGSRNLPATLNQSGAATSVDLVIPEPVIGQGRVTALTISYQSRDIADRLGGAVTINIPRLVQGNEATSLERVVRVPHTFPPLSSASPQEPASTTQDEDYVSYTFPAAAASSLTLHLGDSVVYRLNLDYSITNPTLQSQDTEIALPPDTAYQQIILDRLDPPPADIRLDPDGNWLARYPLAPSAKQAVSATLYARVSALPRYFDPSATNPALTSSQSFWETRDPHVAALAKQLKSPENIYDYLVNNFTYNPQRIKIGAERLGAAAALDRPSDALCTEFTDTFVALARASGTMAREINGYAYSSNPVLRPLGTGTDILHSWPEYYDTKSKSWVSVDPTWGQTTGGINYYRKLDFSHLTFVRHGAESTYPLPAGVYRQDAGSKQINVAIADSVPDPRPDYSVTVSNDRITVVNTGNAALINRDITVGSDTLHLVYLPPAGHYATSVPSKTPALRWPLLALAAGVVLVLAWGMVRSIHAQHRRQNSRHHG